MRSSLGATAQGRTYSHDLAQPSPGSKEEERHGVTASAELAVEAVRRDPGRADYWNWLGLARDVAQDWRGSGDAYAEAARRAPYNPIFWSNLARSRARQALVNDLRVAAAEISLRRGDIPTAQVHARRAAQLDPTNPEVVQLLTQLPKN